MDQGHPPPTTSGPLSRRRLLRASGATAAALGATGLLGTAASADPAPTPAARPGTRQVPPDRISIQLYTLRDQLAVDLPGTLTALHAIGYRRVEHAGFVGRTAAQFRAALDAAGLRATSGHAGIPQPFDATFLDGGHDGADDLRGVFVAEYTDAPTEPDVPPRTASATVVLEPSTAG